MTTSEIIEDVLLSEGEGKPPYLVSGDKGGRTSWGISERFHPSAWLHGPPTKDQARKILTLIYALPWEGILDPSLRAQLVDISVLHGASKALRWLTEGCGIPIPSPLVKVRVITAVNTAWGECAWDGPHHRVINNALVAARLAWIDTYTDTNPDQAKFKNGWMNRALRFYIKG